MSNADFISTKLSFSWSTDCYSGAMLHYNILASNCGSCPTTTNHTTAACTNVPTNGNSCTFALETVVCRHIVGNRSETIQAVLEGKISQHHNKIEIQCYTISRETFEGENLHKFHHFTGEYRFNGTWNGGME